MTTLTPWALRAPRAALAALAALDVRWGAVLAGFSRGWIETRQTFTETSNLIIIWLAPAMYVVMLLFMSRLTVPGTKFSPATGALPAFLCLALILGGLLAPAGGIVSDREDGTLLRAKATPHGMLGYLVGKIVMCALTTLLQFVVILVPGVMIVSDLILDGWTWLQLAGVFAGGMLATVPIGVALGSVMKSSQIPLLLIGTLAITAVSFYPIVNMPAWLQAPVQALPPYWVGLGIRSALLPVNMVAAEIGDSWRVVEMFAVPGMWAGLGLLFAPVLLRRMARRQSGSALVGERERRTSQGF